MRNALIVSTLFVLVMTACAGEAASTEEPGAGQSDPTSVPEDASMDPTEETVVKQLAQNLGLEESDISVLRNEETDFGDACLDVPLEGTMCAQVVTPGRVIVLEANGVQYAYHISEDGSRVQPATLAMVWRREGGIAGFCDILTVFLSGEVYASSCKAQGESVMSTFSELLSAREELSAGPQVPTEWLAKESFFLGGEFWIWVVKSCRLAAASRLLSRELVSRRVVPSARGHSELRRGRHPRGARARRAGERDRGGDSGGHWRGN